MNKSEREAFTQGYVLGFSKSKGSSSPAPTFSAINEVSEFELLCEIEIEEGLTVQLKLAPWDSPLGIFYDVRYATKASFIYKYSETFSRVLYIVYTQNGIPIAAHKYEDDSKILRVKYNEYGCYPKYVDGVYTPFVLPRYKDSIKDITAAGSYYGTGFTGSVTFTLSYTKCECLYAFNTGELEESSESIENLEVYGQLCDSWFNVLDPYSLHCFITGGNDMWEIKKAIMSAVCKKNTGYGIDDYYKFPEITEPK